MPPPYFDRHTPSNSEHQLRLVVESRDRCPEANRVWVAGCIADDLKANINGPRTSPHDVSEAPSFPVDNSLKILDGKTIYRTDEWHRAAVLYTTKQADPADYDPDIAIYLWHKRDGSWVRKQKYTINSVGGWEDDVAVLERLFDAFRDGESVSGEFENPNEELPVSDYYNVAAGVTVFKTKQWWKAGVVVDEKGDYETTEVFLYVWQHYDGEWKLRQKYSVKELSDWERDAEALDPLLKKLDAERYDDSIDDGTSGDSDATDGKSDRERLRDSLERRHLSRELKQRRS